MIFDRRQLQKHLAKLYDLSVLVFSFILSVLIVRFPAMDMSLADFLGLKVKLGNCLLFAVLLIVWHNVFVLCGLYLSKRLTRPLTEAWQACKAAVLASAVLYGSARVFDLGMVTISFTFVFWAFCAALMVSGRLAARSFLKALRSRGKNARFLLIVGTNERAIEFARQITERPELGYHIVGFVDDDWPGMRNFEQTFHRLCCDFASLANFLRHNVVDEAAIYLPLRSYYEHAAELVSLCEQHGIAIRFDSQIFKLRMPNSYPQVVDDNSQILASAPITETWPILAKRAMDIALSSVLLIVLAPLLICLAVLIRLTSQGPIFFRQTRVGLNKRQFTMFKFRTMVADAEQLQEQLLAQNEMSGPVFKIKKDPRVTPVGAFLRKTSLDELPQLLNVFHGDMSLVGPRAMSLRDYRLFDQDWQRRRFSVKPGITCLWQIYGRNSVPFEKWMELDMQYIDKWSLWLDLKILLRTLPAVLRGTGAA